ncbi:RagB/SusD family nutrient uptake outer membrane protein [Sphingobacterium sp. xlx-130]|uniref:RagB/SusD family nutrient uptake outer membrane protein n=1 Tax=Sphingobacterium sp. xlx-130 TaxID=2654323 RepID=UPI0013D9B6D5|nr:RagB/SusD family nutrient uptake outer membrane protein [Sphingobacterium sp. xlx-130]
MRTKLKNAIYCISLLLTFGSCNSFLDVRPSNNGKIEPRTVEDFEEILNNVFFSEQTYLVADLISDDFHVKDQILESSGTGSAYINTYLWNDNVFGNSEEDVMYNDTYKAILQLNIILDNIDLAPGGNAERKSIVRAQAKLHRAFYYTQLVGIYGWDYQSTTANSDLAVPLVLKPSTNDAPPRATVKEVYDFILQDLQDVINEDKLPPFGSDVLHPGKAAANALLARVNLMLTKYDDALKYAEAALSFKSTLLDYRKMSYKNPSLPFMGVNGKLISIVDQKGNPEIYLAKVGYETGFYYKYKAILEPSHSLVELFNKQPKDLRLAYNFIYLPNSTKPLLTSYTVGGLSSMPFNYSLGVPEMMLIKAECLARSGKNQEAIDALNMLRSYRFKVTDYVAEIVEGDVLARILEERRRELYGKGGLRLFDLKRLNREGVYVTNVERYNDAKTEVIGTLPPKSPRYLMPFSPVVIANNELIIQNER